MSIGSGMISFFSCLLPLFIINKVVFRVLGGLEMGRLLMREIRDIRRGLGRIEG